MSYANTSFAIVRFLLWCVITSLFRIRVEGSEKIPQTGGALLVSNHVSYADAVLVGYPTPRSVRFLIWKPIYETKIVRPFFRILRAIPLALDSPKATIRALRSARAELEAGELVAIFAEGSITRTGELQPFERGYARIIHGLDLPIVPMHLSGLWGHPLSRKGGGVFASWELLWRPKVLIRIGDPVRGPISPDELHNLIASLGEQGEPNYRRNEVQSSII